MRKNSKYYFATTANACNRRSFNLPVPLLPAQLSILLLAFLFVSLGSQNGHASSADGYNTTQRVISTNVCIDNILINMFDIKHVVAVSNLVDDPRYSQVKFLDQKIERISFDAEQILGLRPSIVLISNFSNQRVVRILQKSGTKIITVPYATQFSQLTENIRIIGTAIKQNKKAKQLIKKINQQIDRTATHTDKFALHVTSNNYIYGKNSLISDAIRHAGFSAFDASGFGESHGFVSTESIIASKPDYLITDKIHTVNNFVSSKDRYHPALGTAYPTQNRIYVDPKLWSCAHQSTPQIIDIIKQGAHEK